MKALPPSPMRPVVMFRLLRAAVVVIAAIACHGCAATPRETITQVSTIDALLAGVYDGDLPIGQLRRFGDTGIGTFTQLDGEMVVHQGVTYQIKSDGSVHRPPPQMTTPFATVVRFESTRDAPMPAGMDMPTFCRRLDELEPNRNVFVAIVMEGAFRRVRARSVPAQHKPYEPLADIIGAQSHFDFGDDGEPVRGVMIGFRCPPYVRGLNVPGYHLHFLSEDRTRGGHVLDFTIDNAHARWQAVHRFSVILPRSHDHFAEVDLSQDRAEQLKRVEQ